MGQSLFVAIVRRCGGGGGDPRWQEMSLRVWFVMGAAHDSSVFCLLWFHVGIALTQLGTTRRRQRWRLMPLVLAIPVDRSGCHPVDLGVVVVVVVVVAFKDVRVAVASS